jgi:ubiquinone/menaquinone biosynthesis C-methylase UbiE
VRRVNTTLSFEEYFWKGIDLNGKVVLDAGTGFGITTLEIARRMSVQRQRGRIVSVDIDPNCFELARKLLAKHKLEYVVNFVRADLSNMPQIETESIDIIISTRTISDINRYPCRLIRAVLEFYRVLKSGGHIVLSDECPRFSPLSNDEEVAVSRWRIAKAISHLIGRPHSHEVEPEDLEFMLKLVGFQKYEWTIFKGEKISERRIKHFVDRAKEMVLEVENTKLKNALFDAIEDVQKIFQNKGGVFSPKYIIHAIK